MCDKLAGKLGGVEVFGQTLRADVCAGCATWEDVIGSRMPRVAFSGVQQLQHEGCERYSKGLALLHLFSRNREDVILNPRPLELCVFRRPKH